MAKAVPAETVLGAFRKQNNSSASYAVYSRQADHEVVIPLFQGDCGSLYPYAGCLHRSACTYHTRTYLCNPYNIADCFRSAL